MADRISKAGQLAEYLQLYLDGKPIPIRPPSILELTGRWAQRHRAMLGAVASVLIVTTSIAVAMKVASDIRFRRLQTEVETDVEKGNASLLSGDANEAQRLLAGAIGKIGSERGLLSLRQRGERLLETAQSRLLEQTTRERDRARYESFMTNYDDAMFNGTLFTGRDTSVKHAKVSAWNALGMFGCKEDTAGSLPEDLSGLRLEDSREGPSQGVLL